MAESNSRCTGNCMACSIYQRQYCASQLAYSNMKMLEKMQKVVATIQERIEAIQNGEASVFDPNNPVAAEPQHAIVKTQSGDGVTL